MDLVVHYLQEADCTGSWEEIEACYGLNLEWATASEDPLVQWVDANALLTRKSEVWLLK